MSKMNDLATALDDLVNVATQLKTCAQDLITVTNQLRRLYEAEDTEEPGTSKKKPASRKLETEPEPKPQTPELPAGAPAPEYTKEQIRGMLSDLAGAGHREEAKALVSKYANSGSFSDIDPARYPELAEEVKKISA